MENKIANMIDHTVLKATTTKEDVVKVCKEAKENQFFSVCINPTHIELAKKELEGSNVKVCTVIGFPLGANTPEVKGFETKDAIAKGADEVDMVINIGALKDKNYDLVERDIKAVVDAANKEVLVKVIIETCYLTDEEKKKFTKIGISIHSVEEAKEAEQLGASYLTAGHIYATDCKRGLPPRGLGFLKEVCREVSIPVYGIGGIKFDEEQWNDMKKCGAVGGCVMSGMMEI